MSKYERWSMADLAKEVKRRNLEPDGDSRKRQTLTETLEEDDRFQDQKVAAAKLAADSKPPSLETASDLEQMLHAKVPGHPGLIVWGDVTANRNRVDEQFRVRNLPADFVYGWASLSAAGGEDLGNWVGLGWIRATTDMVSTDPSNTRKIYVSNYEDWNGYVRNRDCLLMIANRRIVEQRKKDRLDAWDRKVAKTFGERGKKTRDQILDPTEETGARMKRTAEWRAEDGLRGGE